MATTVQFGSKRVWLITGCSTGIGAALAREALQRGERVALTARKVDSIRALADEFPNLAMPFALDVNHPADVSRVVAAVVAKAGQIDVLVNNAGYGVVGAVEEVSEREERQIFETNVMGLLSVTRAVLPHMRERRSGRILNISSMTGVFAPPGFGLYSATKFAVEGLSEALAAEVKPLGIRVTIVEPGPFRTNFRGGLVIASKVISDYDATVGPVRRTMSEPGGKQPGDPRLAAKLLIDVVNAAEPPLRLPLGQIAITNIRNKLANMEKELSQWEKAGAATSFTE